jgi:hypothetical protein
MTLGFPEPLGCPSRQGRGLAANITPRTGAGLSHDASRILLDLLNPRVIASLFGVGSGIALATSSDGCKPITSGPSKRGREYKPEISTKNKVAQPCHGNSGEWKRQGSTECAHVFASTSHRINGGHSGCERRRGVGVPVGIVGVEGTVEGYAS